MKGTIRIFISFFMQDEIPGFGIIFWIKRWMSVQQRWVLLDNENITKESDNGCPLSRV